MNEFNLINKSAIITGGGRGLGRAISKALSKAGANVIIADIIYDNALTVAEEINKIGGKAFAISVDVTDSSSVNRMVDFAVEKFGIIDISVNRSEFGRGFGIPPRILDIEHDYCGGL